MVMQQWGEMAVAQAKPIEYELAHRMHTVLQLPEAEEYLRLTGKSGANRSFLGFLVGVLGDEGRLPAEVRHAIRAAGITLQNDPQTIRDLRELGKLRNLGAHSNRFSAADYMKVKSLLFERGLLRRFSDGLSDLNESALEVDP
jgi:hypothetical protein